MRGAHHATPHCGGDGEDHASIRTAGSGEIISGLATGETRTWASWPGSRALKGGATEHCAELRDDHEAVWETGQSEFKGDFSRWTIAVACRFRPRKIPILMTAQSDDGHGLTRPNRRLYFRLERRPCNTPTMVAPSVGACGGHQRGGHELHPPGAHHGDRRRADAAAMAKGSIKAGAGRGGSWPTRAAQQGDDPSRDSAAALTSARSWEHGTAEPGGVLWDLRLDRRMRMSLLGGEMPGVKGVTPKLDEFVVGMEQFGTRRCCNALPRGLPVRLHEQPASRGERRRNVIAFWVFFFFFVFFGVQASAFRRGAANNEKKSGASYRLARCPCVQVGPRRRGEMILDRPVRPASSVHGGEPFSPTTGGNLRHHARRYKTC